MVGDVLRLELAVFSISKALNRVEKIPIVVAVNSANSRVSLFKMNCLCLLISPCELILVLLM